MSTKTNPLISQAFKDPEKLVARVTQHLIKSGQVLDEYYYRGLLGIHPSEMSHENWCPRATYYRLSRTVVEDVLVLPNSLQMEMAFDTGTKIHEWWQERFWEMKILRGLWRCLNCTLVWEAVSPFECPRCEIGKEKLQYAEVPVEDEEHMIVGSMDGDVWMLDDWIPVEMKSISAGTVRIEAPGLLEKYSYKHKDEEGREREGVDWFALWRGIRVPFLHHLKQGMIYLFCTGREWIVFIYIPKFITAYPREFKVRFRKEMIEPLLEQCKIVRKALDKGRPPRRPHWAEEPPNKVCRDCVYRNVCWGERSLDVHGS